MLDFSVTFLITLLNLGILYVALKKVLFDRLGGFMEARSEKIRRSIAEASMAKIGAEELKSRYEELLANAENEGEWVLKDAEERAAEESRELLETARDEAADIRLRAEEAAARELARSRDALASEIARLATQAAARMIGGDSSSADEFAAARIIAELEAERA